MFREMCHWMTRCANIIMCTYTKTSTMSLGNIIAWNHGHTSSVTGHNVKYAALTQLSVRSKWPINICQWSCRA